VQAVAMSRGERLAALYEREAVRVERLVSKRARASRAVIEDACHLTSSSISLNSRWRSRS